LTPALTLTSISSFDIGRQELQQAADGSPLNVLDIDWQSHFRQYSEEARVNYSVTGLNLVGGVYTDGTKQHRQYFHIGSALGPGVDGGFFQNYRQVRHSSAVFIQGDFNITSKLVFTLGARYTEEQSAIRRWVRQFVSSEASTTPMYRSQARAMPRRAGNMRL